MSGGGCRRVGRRPGRAQSHQAEQRSEARARARAETDYTMITDAGPLILAAMHGGGRRGCRTIHSLHLKFSTLY